MRRPSTRTVHAPHWPWSQPFFVPGQIELIAQSIEQRCPRGDLELRFDAVDDQGDGNEVRHLSGIWHGAFSAGGGLCSSPCTFVRAYRFRAPPGHPRYERRAWPQMREIPDFAARAHGERAGEIGSGRLSGYKPRPSRTRPTARLRRAPGLGQAAHLEPQQPLALPSKMERCVLVVYREQGLALALYLASMFIAVSPRR